MLEGHDATDSSRSITRFILQSTEYRLLCYAGSLEGCTSPLINDQRGGVDTLTARLLTEQHQDMPLWSSCDMLYKFQGPPQSSSASRVSHYSFCYDHLRLSIHKDLPGVAVLNDGMCLCFIRRGDSVDRGWRKPGLEGD